MRGTSSRRGNAIASTAALLLAALPALAGGPLELRDDGGFYLWNTAAPIAYRTDSGPLSATVNETQARARVASMFDAWQNVATSNIRYARAGSINATGAFGGGDVNTLAEFSAVAASCDAGQQSPIVYDADGSIFVALGFDETSVIGFAGPCQLTGTEIRSGLAVMNGLFQDGQGFDLPAAAFDAAMIHEFGHFSGLDHSQINLGCLFGPCGDDLQALPTMFPILLDVSQASLSPDDIAWISRLYPQTATPPFFAVTHGMITGTIYFSDGQSHVQLANVIARQVDTGFNEDRRIAVSVVSGYRFRVFHSNPITHPAPSPGSELPEQIGLYEIPVPAGSYTIEVESIWPEFVGGSGVGPGFNIAVPGPPPQPVGPIVVQSGQTVTDVDVTLTFSPPRFDSFESP